MSALHPYLFRDEAELLWRGNHLLQRVYPDLQCFIEHHRIACKGATAEAFCKFLERDAEDVNSLVQARIRQSVADSPCSPPRLDLPAAKRVGARLLLWLYGPISYSTDALVAALKEHADAVAVIVRIDSPGGSLDDAFRIAGAIAGHRGRSVAIVDRACLSAAVVVATACDRILVREGATMMVHQARAAAFGTAEQLIEQVVGLRRADGQLLRHLSIRRRGRCWRDLVEREVFHDARAAVAIGLADQVISPLPSDVQPGGASSRLQITEEITMFEKTEFQKASRCLTKAEANLQSQQRRLDEIDTAIREAEEELDRLRGAASAQMNSDLQKSIAELADEMDRNSALQQKHDSRIEQYQRLRAAKAVDVDVAKLAVRDAEELVNLAQRKAWEEAHALAVERIWEAIRDPLHTLFVTESALAYYSNLPKGLDEARRAWNMLLIDDVASNTLPSLIEERVKDDTRFLSSVSFEYTPKGLPQVQAVRSEQLSALDRQAMGALMGDSRPVDVATFKARLEALAAPPPSNDDLAPGTVGQQIMYWSSRILSLEDRLQHINNPRNLRYEAVVGANSVNPAKLRARDREVTERQLGEARAALGSWQQRTAA